MATLIKFKQIHANFVQQQNETPVFLNQVTKNSFIRELKEYTLALKKFKKKKRELTKNYLDQKIFLSTQTKIWGQEIFRRDLFCELIALCCDWHDQSASEEKAMNLIFQQALKNIFQNSDSLPVTPELFFQKQLKKQFKLIFNFERKFFENYFEIIQSLNFFFNVKNIFLKQTSENFSYVDLFFYENHCNIKCPNKILLKSLILTRQKKGKFFR